MKNDVDLIFNESLSHGKNLVYFGIELLMTERELKNKEYLNIYGSSKKILDYYEKRFPEAYNCVKNILSSKEHYDEWKNEYKRTKSLYLYTEKFSELLFRVQ